MANGYWVRRDVMAAIRGCMTLSGVGPGVRTVETTLRLIRAWAARWEPSAADATDDDWIKALRTMGRLTPDGDVYWKEYA